MKKLLTVFTMALCAMAPYARDWEDPQIVGRNKLPYTATLNLTAPGEAISLNGEWRFNWSKDPESRPADFWQGDYDASGWDLIKVPGNWQTQGYDKPIYTNWTYPFAKDRPRVTSEPPEWYYSYDHRNPVGSHVGIKRVEIKDNVNLDQHIQGVGGINSWGAEPLEIYQVDSYLPHTCTIRLKYESKASGGSK